MKNYGLTSRIENGKELVLEKIFEDSAERIFDLFSETEHLERFWAPHGWELIHSTLNFEPEGEWYYGMKSENSHPNAIDAEMWGISVFKEIKRPEVIETVDFFADKIGEINRERPASKTRMEFISLDDHRMILVSRRIFNSEEELQELINQGLREMTAERWDQLSNYINQLS